MRAHRWPRPLAPVGEQLSLSLGEHLGELAHVLARGSERRAAVEDLLKFQAFLRVHGVRSAVSQPVTWRTLRGIGTGGGAVMLAWTGWR